MSIQLERQNQSRTREGQQKTTNDISFCLKPVESIDPNIFPGFLGQHLDPQRTPKDPQNIHSVTWSSLRISLGDAEVAHFDIS